MTLFSQRLQTNLRIILDTTIQDSRFPVLSAALTQPYTVTVKGNGTLVFRFQNGMELNSKR